MTIRDTICVFTFLSGDGCKPRVLQTLIVYSCFRNYRRLSNTMQMRNYCHNNENNVGSNQRLDLEGVSRSFETIFVKVYITSQMCQYGNYLPLLLQHIVSVAISGSFCSSKPDLREDQGKIRNISNVKSKLNYCKLTIIS